MPGTTGITTVFATDGTPLIAFEGVYASGKSTLAAAVSGWLRAGGQAPATTEWNSSPVLADRILALRRRYELTPRLMAVLELADFTHRVETEVLPALAAAKPVVADRWVQTGLTRSAVRGVDRDWIAGAYAFAPEPDVLVFCRCPLPLTLERRMGTGRGVPGYVSGADFLDEPDDGARFLRYQRALLEEYERLLPPHAIEVDTTRALPRQLAQVQDALATVGVA